MLIQLLYEIGYLLHQVMILLCLFIPTACMLYISLPMLLPVKTLILYFPSVSSCPYYFPGITFCNSNICYPCKLCYFFFST